MLFVLHDQIQDGVPDNLSEGDIAMLLKSCAPLLEKKVILMGESYVLSPQVIAACESKLKDVALTYAEEEKAKGDRGGIARSVSVVDDDDSDDEMQVGGVGRNSIDV